MAEQSARGRRGQTPERLNGGQRGEQARTHERRQCGTDGRRQGAVAGLRRCAVLHAACLHSRGQRRMDAPGLDRLTVTGKHHRPVQVII